MHCDSILLLMEDHDVNLYNKEGHLNLLKMQKGNYLLQCFAMFVQLRKVESPFKYVIRMIDKYYQDIEKYSHIIRPVFTYHDIEKNVEEGVMSSLLTIEEGGVIEGNLAYLRTLYRLGVRMITLTWNYPNEIGYPNINSDIIKKEKLPWQEVKKMIETKNGLTDKGIAIVQEMEQLGIIIDVSHLGDKGVQDVLKYTTKPFVASHSNSRTICNVARNLPDDLLIEMAKRRCVIGINYCPDFVKEDSNQRMYISDLIKHIDYLKNLIGIDYIGLGSDFDGIEGDLEIKDASHMNLLIQALVEAGYQQDEIDKITHQNVLRLFKEIL